MIEYKKGSLFEAPKENTILVHACNCKGVWGSGVAKEFKARFPKQFEDYNKICKSWGKSLLGLTIQYHCGGEQSVGYIFTSDGYGENVDSVESIIKHTRSAIRNLVALLPNGFVIHSPKINSGLFRVPWEKTEEIIKEEIAKCTGLKWVVHEI